MRRIFFRWWLGALGFSFVALIGLLAPDTEAQTARDGNARDASGTVRATRCHDRQLELDLATQAGNLHLQGTVGSFRLVLPQPMAAGFKLCSQLNGRGVAVRYTPGGTGDASAGTIVALRVLPTGASSASTKASGGGASRAAGHANDDLTTPTVEGKVIEVTCTGDEMTLKVSAGEREIVLHARDYSRVNYEQEVGFDAREFQPCTQLKDRSASVTYITARNKPYAGEIQSIEVLP